MRCDAYELLNETFPRKAGAFVEKESFKTKTKKKKQKKLSGAGNTSEELYFGT